MITEEELKRRHYRVLKCAGELTMKKGIDRWSQSQVASLAKVGHGCIQNYYGSMEYLRVAVVREAIAARHPGILAQAAAHPLYRKLLSPEHRELAATYLVG